MSTYPPKPSPGDKVAIVSPSGGLPELFPGPYELGLRRLEEDFGLVPVEYPTTRRLRSSPVDRAADLHAAFADPEIRAVIATIGGEDQITVLKHLDAELFRANPKPFFGYSDNTNLLNYLHGLDLVGYHGGSVMVQFGRSGAMHPDSAASLRAALFTSGEFDLKPAEGWTDIGRDWADPANLLDEPPLKPGTGWQWHGPDRVVEGALWGGCLEIVDWQLAADRWMQPVDAYDGILFLETSEDMPPAAQVYLILRNLGERGLLSRFDAVLWGRPKAWEFGNQLSEAEGVQFVEDQYAAVRRALGEYHPDAVLVTGLDIGHTDPQLVLPYGGQARVDVPAHRITVTY
jgi:muramoyltetrapeptide carboxypeptidase LdcA involved in peptidoglycan recycling